MGIDKHYEDGEQQQLRDEKMKISLDAQAMVHWKAAKNEHPSAWIMGHDVLGFVSVYEKEENMLMIILGKR
jgi:hypothetical protein